MQNYTIQKLMVAGRGFVASVIAINADNTAICMTTLYL